jgi:hypothetical protein
MMTQTDRLSGKQQLLQALANPPVRSQVFSTTRLQSLWLRRACLHVAYVAASRYGAMVPSRGAAVLLGLHRTNRTKSVRARELLPFMTPQARAGRP